MNNAQAKGRVFKIEMEEDNLLAKKQNLRNVQTKPNWQDPYFSSCHAQYLLSGSDGMAWNKHEEGHDVQQQPGLQEGWKGAVSVPQ